MAQTQQQPGVNHALVRELRRRMTAKGLGQKALAIKAGLNETAVRDILKGKSANPTAKTLQQLARALDCTVDELLGQSPTPRAALPLTKVAVIGHVQAGTWREAMEWPEEDRFVITLTPDEHYPGLPRFALKVLGPSMDEVYPDGSVILCVRYADLGRGPRSGDKVVCQRRNRDALVEATVKEYLVDAEGRTWLMPRSSHPEHKTPIALPTQGIGGFSDDATAFIYEAVKADVRVLDDGNTEDVEILAKVTGSFRPEPP